MRGLHPLTRAPCPSPCGRLLSRPPGNKSTDSPGNKSRSAFWRSTGSIFALRIGAVLKPKFDLTSLSKIKKAYVAAFEKDEALDHALDGDDLDLLEASRHLIVHKGGMVDEEFQKRVAKVGIAYPVGDLLPLDGAMVSRMANAAIAAGCRLLAFVDDWLVKNPS